MRRRIDETSIEGGRGQAVGLYTRLLWRDTPRHRSASNVAVRGSPLGVALSWWSLAAVAGRSHLYAGALRLVTRGLTILP